MDLAPEAWSAVDRLERTATDGHYSVDDLNRAMNELQVSAIYYREIVNELESRGLELGERVADGQVSADDDAEDVGGATRAERRLDTGFASRDGFGHFMAVAGDHRILTAEEEVELGRTIQRGEESRRRLEEYGPRLTVDQRRVLKRNIDRGDGARAELVRCNVRLAVYAVRKHAPHHQRLSMEFEDIFQEAIIGLNRAAEKYDPESGNKFSTYAMWWLRQSIQRSTAQYGSIIRLPAHVHEQIWKVKKFVRRCEREQSPVDLPALAAHLDTSEERASDLLILATGGGVGAIRSLDDPFEEDGAFSLGDLVADDDETPDQHAVISDGIGRLNAALASLDEREQLIIVMRYGLDGEEPKTLEAVGELFELTRERVRQLQNRALKKLKHVTTLRTLLGDFEAAA